MKNLVKTVLLCAGLVPTWAMAQEVDRTLYPDYSELKNPDYSLLENNWQSAVKTTRGAVDEQLPDHVNNAELKCFPPVFNQAGGSCGSASRICYMFTHEINSYRGVDGSLPENQYPSHFVWLFTYGNSGKESFVKYVGVPNATVYGGRTYSHLFGNQDASDSDFGWMQGYDKWFSAMHNRMITTGDYPSHVGTPEGRLALKRWLYNHNGDESFHGGGIAGIGVAASGNWQPIPSSPANIEAGVVGKKYVKRWGTQVNHALTIVGYDDRIEFDLNGNGVLGEESADEKGAWIIVNSWGSNWCNRGFVYCPYAYGGKSFKEVKPNEFVFNRNFWYPEVYKVRKDYRPLRTIKLLMDYSRRSEICLSAGISDNLSDTVPQQTILFNHFRYGGDGNGGASNPAPEVPMLGRWADRKLHTEPMEFGYDLTDLSAKFDKNKPLKYFFIVETRDWAQGHGKIYNASIIDYEFNRNGIETPFDLQGKDVEIQNKGNKTIISTVVYGETFYAPQNLSIADRQLTWQKPLASTHRLEGFKIYRNGVELEQVGADVLNFTTPENKKACTYAVSAVYENGVESAKISVNTTVEKQRINMVTNFHHAGFSIPNIFNKVYNEATLEYWIKPNSVQSWNQSGGPGWGKFQFHTNSSGQFTAGWATGEHRCYTPGGTLVVGKWTHLAIVVKKNNLIIYVNGKKSASLTSSKYSGIGGWGNLKFGEEETDARLDEIRIWNYARTAEQIENHYNVEYSGDVLPDGLISYFKGDTVSVDGKNYLFDCKGGNHANIVRKAFKQEIQPTFRLEAPHDALEVKIDSLESPVYVGIPHMFTSTKSESVNKLLWTAEGAGVKNFAAQAPELTFSKSGKQLVAVEALDADGKSVKATYEVMVEECPAPDAGFTVQNKVISAGENLCLVTNHPMLGYRYEWNMPGAVVEKMNSVNATAVYEAQGDYKVTLTVTAPNGKSASTTQTISVTEVAPKANFEIAPAVIVKGETTFLNDKSRYNPTSWEWFLNSENGCMFVNGQNSSLTPEMTGVFDVTLSVKNGKGADKMTRNRALIVCNADSKNGLQFSHSASKLTLNKVPFVEGDKTFTIDWWMNPAELTNGCIGIGDTENNFKINSDKEGAFHVKLNRKNVESNKEMIIAGEWHHYAITFDGMKLYFYRDGKEICRRVTGRCGMPLLKDFVIGGVENPLMGQIDEFRIWNTVLGLEKIKSYANAPIEDVDKAVADDELLVYYNFNQSGGDVVDATPNKNNAVRSGFGPDGDAWGLSSGVFCLNFVKDNSAKDVTSQYLKNSKAPFTHTDKIVSNSSANRFYQISDWTLDNVKVENGVTTGVHVDKLKGSAFTFTSLWGDFSTLENHKVYQTVTLPAGKYTFSANYGDFEGSCGYSYVVAAVGDSLPDSNNVEVEALAAQLMKDKSEVNGNSVSFVLSKETTVSLGLVINLIHKACCTIDNFTLIRSDIDAYEADNANGYDLTIDQSGYNTVYLAYPTVIPEGVTAYVAKSVKGNEVYLEPILDGIVPAKTGVVVAATAGEYHFAPSTVSSAQTSLLTGVLAETETDIAKHYYSFDAQQKPGFYLYNGSSLPANKAFLVTDADDANEAYYINIVPVGIDEITGDNSEAEMFDISGRRVNKPVKGIYISNGKKVLVK